MPTVNELLSKLISLRGPCPEICDGTFPLGGPQGTSVINILTGLPIGSTGNTVNPPPPCTCETWTLDVSQTDLDNATGNFDVIKNNAVFFVYYDCNSQLQVELIYTSGIHSYCLSKTMINPNFPDVISPPFYGYSVNDTELFYGIDSISSTIVSRTNCC